MKKLRPIHALPLTLALTLSLTACGSKDESGDTWNMSYWMPVGEDTSYYPEYEDNPVYKYISANYEFNGKHINIDFNVAPPGAEADDFSTLLGTNSYSDIMDLNLAGATPSELYEEDILWDLTELVPAHMPNYWAFLEANPDLMDVLYHYIDGERRIISLRGVTNSPQSNFEGYCYRRDWIVKYGSNPQTGEPFTGGYGTPGDVSTWTDDVVFPNGSGEPLYISDWEWMFEIFTRAIAAEGIEDGYCFAPYAYGYLATGDLYTGFGGGAPAWYMDGDTVVNGVIDDSMRAYLQCINTWYDNGWIDKVFDEHTSDMFFAVDTESVFQGKVGLWQGRQSTVGASIDAVDGIMVYGARQPINDIYGGEEQQNKEPNMMFQYTRWQAPVVLTKNLTEDEVIAFLEFVDFLYTDEGKIMSNLGLTGEQNAKDPAELYARLGIADGCFTTREENGKTIYVPKVSTETYDWNSISLCRFSLRCSIEDQIDMGRDKILQEAISNWDYYLNTASLPESVVGAVSIEQNQEITKINASLNNYLQRTVPALIKGEGYDIWDDAGWEQFVNSVQKYRSEEITQIYQDTYDMVKGV